MANVGYGSYQVKDGDTKYGRSEYKVDWSVEKSEDKLTFSIIVTGTDTSTTGTYYHYLTDVTINIGNQTYTLFSGREYLGHWYYIETSSSRGYYISGSIAAGQIETAMPYVDEKVTIYTKTVLNQGGSTIYGDTTDITSGLNANAFRPYGYDLILSKDTGINSVSGSGTYSQGTSVNIDATIQNGYIWKEWTGDTSVLNKSASTKSNSLTMPKQKITLTATATPISYKIIFDAQGGIAQWTEKTVLFGQKYENLIPEATRTGYTFNGWYTESQNGNKITTDTTHNIASDITYYAQWIPNTFTIAYSANGGLGSMSDSIHDYSTPSNLTACSFTKTNYSFAGWNTKSDGSGTFYNDQHDANTLAANEQIPTNSIYPLYAQWKLTGIRFFDGNKWVSGRIKVYHNNVWY